jgi:hypothetical protein
MIPRNPAKPQKKTLAQKNFSRFVIHVASIDRAGVLFPAGRA